MGIPAGQSVASQIYVNLSRSIGGGSTMRYASLSLGGLLLLIVGAASATELQGPVVIGPTPGAKPPLPPAGCPPIPRLSADVTMTSIVLRQRARTIGPFSV